MASNHSQSIFFDLETTDLLKVGQILNYCFIVVDHEWSIIDSLSGTVRISPLQLPRATAILANRTMVSEHQRLATVNEREALGSINSFIRKYAEQSPRLPLIGYNSDKFDVHYLRTSLLRNGFLPYLPVEAKDLLITSRSLLLTNSEFRALVFKQDPSNLRLETLCKAHGLLDGDQLHESSADVELTIKLAKTYADLYGRDIRTFEPYQLKDHHNSKSPIVVQRSTPRISATSYQSEKIMIHLLAADKASLWVDLEDFEKRQESEEINSSVKYMRHTDACCYRLLDTDQERFSELALKALDSLSGISMNDLFPPRGCYIEEWIYKLPYSEMDRLTQMMAKRNLDTSISAEAKSLYSRYLLEDDSSSSWRESFETYCAYRYGRTMIVDEKKTAKGITPVFHPTIDELYEELNKLIHKSTAKDLELLQDLLAFYDSSPIPPIGRSATKRVTAL